ncbi:protease inhibitor I42 family protein [Actinophytocola algeriensis]|uniref:protease inhibitor I42 family protein n=1 Tax=Actinophytocola algeriensis TaxID=1768010 RepID=UPI00160EA9EE|nr:protease inhibitor I42 family protein [Actinophytocola algeriensis]
MITARVGGTVTLALPENPATGFRWRLTSPLAVVSDEYFPSGTAPGGAGERVFVLLVAAAGRHEVLAELTRPWESTVKDVRTFVVDAS